ncbi:MAG: hypothetical protein QNL04_13830, partial [SAR324 cluster bacterium]|nr:hypothetical protein [SAR324 cluster bacterium]
LSSGACGASLEYFGRLAPLKGPSALSIHIPKPSQKNGQKKAHYFEQAMGFSFYIPKIILALGCS